MDQKQQQAIIDEVRLCLNQIALELEASAQGARSAMAVLHDRKASWVHIQQLYSRLGQATHLVNKFQKTIDEAIAQEQASSADH